VLGVDTAPLAIKKAKAKAALRHSSARFEVADATGLQALGRSFDVALDCGLFHVFSDRERARYVKGLHAVLRPGGEYYMLCFSDNEPDWGGPRRIRRQEILESFSGGWRVASLRRAWLEALVEGAGAEAWFCRILKEA
jgi:SAM-dependent methyltransferase